MKEGYVNIAGIDKAVLLKALFTNSRANGMSFLNAPN